MSGEAINTGFDLARQERPCLVVAPAVFDRECERQGTKEPKRLGFRLVRSEYVEEAE